LLRSSPQSKVVGTPVIVSLQSIRNSEDASSFNDGLKPTAVLLEGEFKSAYAERTLPIQFPNSVTKSNYSSMVIAADGDLMANGVTQGIPDKLGVNKWTNEHYGNKDFLMNSIHYLLGDTDLLNVRSKSVNIQFLDKEKAYVEANKWQAINLMLPLVLLALFGLSYTYFRKKKYQTS